MIRRKTKTGLICGVLVALAFSGGARAYDLEPNKWTIINHGACGEEDGICDQRDVWMLPLAEKIQDDSGGESETVIHLFDPENFSLDNQSVLENTNVHHILVFDWSATSIEIWNDKNTQKEELPISKNGGGIKEAHPDGYAYAAGDALFSLIKAYGLENNISHYIGHSRGAVVGSEFVRRMFLYGHSIKQVIYLDGEGGALLLAEPYNDLRFTAWPTQGLGECRFDNVYSEYIEGVGDLGNGIFVFGETGECNTYFDYGGNYRPRCQNYNLKRNYRHGGCGDDEESIVRQIPNYLLNHLDYSNTHNYFTFGDTVDFLDENHLIPVRTDANENMSPMELTNWDAYGGGDYDGDEPTQDPDDPWSAPNCEALSHDSDSSLFNGDFSWGSKAGWRSQGGVFECNLYGWDYTENRCAVFGWPNFNHTETMRHSWVWFPGNSTHIAYSIKASRDLVFGTDGFEVYLVDWETGIRHPLKSYDLSDSFDWKDELLELPGGWAGKVATIEFTFSPGTVDNFNVYIDNVGIKKSGSTGPTVSIQYPYNGQTLTEDIIEIEAEASSSGYGLRYVDFVVDGVLHLRDENYPYSCQWGAAQAGPGEHTVTARAVDQSYNTTTHDIMVIVEGDQLYTNDYKISGLSVNPQNPSVGENVLISAQLENAGSADQTYDQTVRLFVDGDLEEIIIVGGLYQGEVQDIQFDWAGIDGAHTIRVQAFLLGDENEQNDWAETAIVVGASGHLLVDGALGSQRLVSATQGSNQQFGFHLSNTGDDPLQATISISGSQAGWIDIASSVYVEGGETKVLGWTLSVPSEADLGSHSATVKFDTGTQEIEALINIQVVEYSEGSYFSQLMTDLVTIDGSPQSSQSTGDTYYHLDNDPDTIYDSRIEFEIDLGSGNNSKYDRMYEAEMDLWALEHSQPSGLLVDLEVDGPGGGFIASQDVNREDVDIMGWLKQDQNELVVGLGAHQVGLANVDWNVLKSMFYFRFTQDAWGVQSYIDSAELQRMQDGWDRGRIYFDVENEINEGRLYLYIDGHLVDTVDSDDRYFEINANDLSETPYFNIKGDHEDQTAVRVTDIYLDVDYFTGSPSLLVGRGVPENTILVGNSFPVTMTFQNSGSNKAEDISSGGFVFPENIVKMSGPNAVQIDELDPGQFQSVIVSIRSTEPGQYNLAPALIECSDPSGSQYFATLPATSFVVSGGSLNAQLELGSDSVDLNQSLTVACRIVRSSDQAPVFNANVVCSITDPSGDEVSFALTGSQEENLYSSVYQATYEEGEYSIALNCSAPYCEDLLVEYGGAFSVTNQTTGPLVLVGYATQEGASGVRFNSVVVPGESGGSCRVVYGLEPSFGYQTQPEILPATLDSVAVDFLISDLVPGNEYFFQLVAQNQGGSSFSPTQSVFINRMPVIAFAGESGYWVDGHEPQVAEAGDPVTFKVKYSDHDGHPPADGYPCVHLFNNGDEIAGSPFEMFPADTTSYVQGRIFSRTISNLIASDQYTYRFEALDVFFSEAQGATGTLPGPEIIEGQGAQIQLETTELEVQEGESNTCNFWLSGPPDGLTLVSVDFVSGDTDLEILEPGPFDFWPANFDSARTVTFSANEDDDDINGVAVFGFTPSGGGTQGDIQLQVQEVDDEGCPMSEEGDLNCDCVVNIIDVVTVTGNYGRECGDPDVCVEDCSDSDIVPDCNVNIIDVVSVTGHYGETCDGAIVLADDSDGERAGGVYFTVLERPESIGDTLRVGITTEDFSQDPFAFQLSLIYSENNLEYVGGHIKAPQGIHDRDFIVLDGGKPASGATPLMAISRLGDARTKTIEKGALAILTFIADETGDAWISWHDPSCMFVTRSGNEFQVEYGGRVDVPIGNNSAQESVFMLASENPSGRGFEFYLSEEVGNTVQLSIYDIRGRLVRNLYEGPASSSGLAVYWDGKNSAGHKMESGVYFALLKGAKGQKTKRVVWIK